MEKGINSLYHYVVSFHTIDYCIDILYRLKSHVEKLLNLLFFFIIWKMSL